MDKRALYETCLRLNVSHDLAPFKLWLTYELENNRDILMTAVGDGFLRTQGRALMLKEIVDLLEQSSTLLEKMR